MKRNYLAWLLIPVSLFFLYFLFRGITTPFVGPNATNYNWYSLIAHNYVQFGFLSTKFLQILTPITSLNDPMRLYLHHPPFISIFEAVSFILFGEHYWSGRFVVILFALGSSFLFFMIGRLLKNTQFGMLALLVSFLIPAASVFGQMIGQEPLVLFFALLTVFATMKYLETKKTMFLVVAIASVISGTLSDWPMVYFTLALLPYFLFVKQKKVGLSLVAVSVITAVLFLLYVFTFNHGFSDLQSAFTTRSLGILLHQSVWPVRWVSIIGIRFMLYYNPIFVIFSFGILISMMRRKKTAVSYLLVGFFLFGMIHILLYPEGSFGHPYWTYYMLPFFVFGSAEVIDMLLHKKRFVFLMLIFLYSLGWIWKIEDWKTKQIDANLWRYTLMQQVDKRLSSHEAIALNPDSAIDSDLIEYAFLHKVSIINVNNLLKLPSSIHHYVLACTVVCSKSEVNQISGYVSTHVKNAGGEAYILDLPKKTNNTVVTTPIKTPSASVPTDHGIKALYRQIKNILNAPQL